MRGFILEEDIRLSKLMAQKGICSRREADRYIESGQVLVDGEVISVLGTKVSPYARVELKSRARKIQQNKVTIILNKPIGFVSTQPEKGYHPAVELITAQNQYRPGKRDKFSPSHLKKLGVAGRLDIDSKGLMVLSQDGALVKKLIGEDCEMEKEYIVAVEGRLTGATLTKLRYGLRLYGKMLKHAKVEEIQPNLLRFVLIEGKKRQIRKMCEMMKLKVTKLKRVRIGGVRLGDLPEGKWRYLKPGESFE